MPIVTNTELEAQIAASIRETEARAEELARAEVTPRPHLCSTEIEGDHGQPCGVCEGEIEDLEGAFRAFLPEGRLLAFTYGVVEFLDGDRDELDRPVDRIPF